MTDVVPVSERVEGPTVLGDACERWLAARLQHVTASDAAAILGEDQRRGPLAVYAEKIGAIQAADLDHMAFGRDVEGAIAKGYRRRTSRPVLERDPYELIEHPDIPWLAATPDRVTEGIDALPAPAAGRGPLECKAVAAFKAAAWEEQPPIEYQIQLQIQMACMGAAWGSLVALIGGLQIVWKDIPRHDRFLSNALPRLEEFHLRVLRRDPPPEIDARPATTAAISALYAKGDGSTVALSHDDRCIGECCSATCPLAVANRWEAAQERAAQAETEADELENELRFRVASATFGALPDGTFLTLKETHRRGYIREVKPKTFRSLRRYRPRLRRRA